jgi:hypothetical protein
MIMMMLVMKIAIVDDADDDGRRTGEEGRLGLVSGVH